MKRNSSSLTERDHENMGTFLGHVLDDYKHGTITREQAISAVAHVMAALDERNYDEARNWLEQGGKFIRE